jgi:DNA polymerase
VLFIGEGPGESEDVIGKPFVGPAGHLQDHIIAEAFAGRELRRAFTNLVGCIPREEGVNTAKADQPLPEEIRACSPRLIAFVDLCQPKLIVCVGKLAGDWLAGRLLKGIKLNLQVPTVEQQHPAAILKTPAAHQNLAYRRAVVVLKMAIEKHCL